MALKIQKRLKEFGGQELCIMDGRLYCAACNKNISDDITSIKRHILTQNHKKGIENIKNNGIQIQKSMKECKNLAFQKHSICEDFTLCCMMFGLSFNQGAALRQTFLQKYKMNNIGSMGSSHDSIGNYGKDSKETIIKIIIDAINTSNTYNIIFDETDDLYDDRAVCNVLYKDESGLLLLLECNITEQSITNEYIVQMIFDVIIKYSLNRNLCISLATDSASYNIAAFEKIKLLCTNCVHILDISHKLDTCLKNVLHDALLIETVEYLKDSYHYFSHSRARKFRYRECLQENELKVNEDLMVAYYAVNFNNVPPRILDTRWATAVSSIRYHKHRLNDLRLFWEKEGLDDATDYESLHVLIVFMDYIFEKITTCIIFFQNSKNSIQKAHNKLQDLITYYNTNLSLSNLPSTVNKKIEHLGCNAKKSWLVTFNKIRNKISDQISEKLDITSDQFLILENIANFDISNPNKAPKSEFAFPNLKLFNALTSVEKSAIQDEYQLYLMDTAQYHKDQIADSIGYFQDKLKLFPLLAKLALQYLQMPIGSCDAERSFSKYTWICSDYQRNQMSDETKSTRMMAVFNKDVILKARNMATI